MLPFFEAKVISIQACTKNYFVLLGYPLFRLQICASKTSVYTQLRLKKDFLQITVFHPNA
jgi:hypothetical protein